MHHRTTHNRCVKKKYIYLSTTTNVEPEVHKKKKILNITWITNNDTQERERERERHTHKRNIIFLPRAITMETNSLENIQVFITQQPKVTHGKQTPDSNNEENNTQIPVGLKPNGTDQNLNICCTHTYFAKKSRTCKLWCKWPQKQNIQMLPSSIS